MKRIKEWWKKLKYWQICGIVALFLTFFVPWIVKVLTGSDFFADVVIYPSFVLCQIISSVFEPVFCAVYISPFINIIIGMIIGKIIDMKRIKNE